MKQKLFLTSGGIGEELKKDFLKLLVKNPNESLIYFVPTASDPEKSKDYVETDRNKLRKIGLKIADLELKVESEESLKDKLSVCDIVYITGGNTFYLLDWIKKSRFDKVIYKFLESGKLYAGASAGSYIACPTIEQSTWKHQDRNRIGLTDLNALNLVPFLISAHYRQEFKSTIENASKTSKYPIVALTDQQAVLVEGEEWRIVGKGTRVTFNLNEIDKLTRSRKNVNL